MNIKDVERGYRMGIKSERERCVGWVRWFKGEIERRGKDPDGPYLVEALIKLLMTNIRRTNGND